MTRIHESRLLIAGLTLVTAALVGGVMTGPGWGTHLGSWHGSMMGPMMGGWEGPGTDSPIRGAAEVQITATDFAFSPTEITVTSGQPVNLTLVNSGSVPHDLSVADFDVHIVARPGQSSTVGFTPTGPGTFSIVCTYPGHANAGMRGTLTVVEP